jgi:hypothetical protein
MKILNKIFAFIMLALITLSSIGISFYVHECGCRETTLFNVETGFNKSPAFCCCGPDSVIPNASDTSRSIENEDCCKDQYIFFLLPFVPESNTTNIVVLDYKIISHLIDNSIATHTDSPKAINEISLPHSPPDIRSGKELVFFIGQIKIPLPVC